MNGVVECKVCGSKVNASPVRTVSKAYDKAYDRHRNDLSSKFRLLNVMLVVSDCCLLGLQVRGTAIQPPIAPQLTCIDPLQQLFSTPSIFSLPVDFNSMREQKPQSEIKASFLSEHTFFEAQASGTFQSTNSFVPPFTSPSLQMHMPVLDRMSTPLQPTLGGSENNFMRSNFLSPEAVYGLETFLAKGITSESQSLTSVSIPDPGINDTLIPLPFLDPIKVDESNPHIDQEDALRWVLPPVSLEKTDVPRLFKASTVSP